ncbi:MAG: hypothetical protein M4579_007309, partial [Chaenotheca gracillima]
MRRHINPKTFRKFAGAVAPAGGPNKKRKSQQDDADQRENEHSQKTTYGHLDPLDPDFLQGLEDDNEDTWRIYDREEDEGAADVRQDATGMTDLIPEAFDDDLPTDEEDKDDRPTAGHLELEDPPDEDMPPIEEFIADVDTVNLDVDDNVEERQAETMLPPSRRPSATDTSEQIPHKRSVYIMDDFTFALGLWCNQSNIGRQQYSSLLETLALLKDVNQIKTLPKDVTTLKRSVTAQLPLIEQRRKSIPLLPDKMPTLTPKMKANVPSMPTAWLYWFDPVALFIAILSSPILVKKMHFGMANFVDNPS